MQTDADEEVLRQLENDVGRLSLMLAREATTGIASLLGRWLASLPLAGMLGWVLYRLGMAWYREIYLPLSFYAMGLLLTATAAVVSWWLLSRLVRGKLQALEPADLVTRIEQPRATLALRLAAGQLRQFVDAARQLGRLLDDHRAYARQRLLSAESFGAVVADETPKPGNGLS